MAKAYDRILIALDGAGLASDALVAGLTLAKELGSSVRVVHAVDALPTIWPDSAYLYGGTSPVDIPALEASAMDHAERNCTEVLSRACREAGLAREAPQSLLQVLPGQPAPVILQAAEDFRADLLVLGPHARRPLLDFGSTTRAILERTRIPLWTQHEPFESIHRILVTVDLSEHSARALGCAQELAADLGASIGVLHCWEPPDLGYTSSEDPAGPIYVVEHDRRRAEEQFKRWMEARGVVAQTSFCEGKPVQKILEVSEAFDLVVMGTHGRAGLARLLLGSVAYATLKQCRKPVLAIPRLRGAGEAEESAAAATQALES